MTEILVNTEEELDVLLSDEDSDTLVLFTAPSWCIPCRRFEPHWNKSQARLGHINMVKVDLGNNPDISGHWAIERFGVRSVPTVKYFFGGTDKNVDIKARAVVPFVKEVLS